MRIAFPVLVLTALIATGCGEPAPPAAAPPGPPLVTVAKPLVDKMTDFNDLTGTLESPDIVQLRARVSGYIQEVKFKDGEEVKVGQVLFQIDPTTYDAEVKKIEKQIEQAQANVTLATTEEKRSRALLEGKAASQQEYDVTAAKLAVSLADVAAVKESIRIARQNLEWCQVTAPIAGKVDRAYLTKGNVATGGTTQGTVLTTIVTVNPMDAYFDVDDQTVLYVQRLLGKKVDNGGLPAMLQIAGEKGYPHPGRMNFVSNRINASTGSLQVRGTFANADGLLLPGRFVRARVPLGEPREVLLLPADAVQNEQARKVVYVVEDKKVVVRNVKLGPMEKGLRVIAEGLNATDTVVIKGLQRVRPGSPVETVDGKIETKAE